MIRLRSGSKHLIREINQSIVLNTVRTHGALSRTDIAALAQLSLATVSGITAELIESGLLVEQPAGSSTGGRRPIPLALNPQAGYAVGIKLTQAALIAVLTDLDGTVVAQHTEPLRHHASQQVVASAAATVQTLSRAAGGRPIFGVGVGMAGVIDRERGMVRYTTYFDWRDLPFAQLLEEQLDLPVLIDNDVNGVTAAEHWFGAGRGARHALAICIGQGIGLGMVLDGALYRGAIGGAGEFGHITVQPDGPRCMCGKRGCLEALIGVPALLQRIAATLGRPVALDRAVRLARQGDLALRTTFATAGHTLGLAAANLVNVLNPELIIVGGEGMVAGDLLVEPFQEALYAHCFSGLADNLQVVSAQWSDETWARGAASLLLSALFQPALFRGEEDGPSFSQAQGLGARG